MVPDTTDDRTWSLTLIEMVLPIYSRRRDVGALAVVHECTACVTLEDQVLGDADGADWMAYVLVSSPSAKRPNMVKWYLDVAVTTYS